MSTEITLFEITLFSLSSHVTSQGDDNDLLVYTISSPDPTPTLVLVKPPITQICSRSQNPPISSPTSTASSSDPIHNDDLFFLSAKSSI